MKKINDITPNRRATAWNAAARRRRFRLYASPCSAQRSEPSGALRPTVNGPNCSSVLLKTAAKASQDVQRPPALYAPPSMAQTVVLYCSKRLPKPPVLLRLSAAVGQ